MGKTEFEGKKMEQRHNGQFVVVDEKPSYYGTFDISLYYEWQDKELSENIHGTLVTFRAMLEEWHGAGGGFVNIIGGVPIW